MPFNAELYLSAEDRETYRRLEDVNRSIVIRSLKKLNPEEMRRFEYINNIQEYLTDVVDVINRRGENHDGHELVQQVADMIKPYELIIVGNKIVSTDDFTSCMEMLHEIEPQLCRDPNLCLSKVMRQAFIGVRKTLDDSEASRFIDIKNYLNRLQDLCNK